MDDRQQRKRQTVRRLSAELFGGASYRLEVCAALHSNEQFTASDLVLLLGDPPGKASVHTELRRLRSAGLVHELGRNRSDRHKYLQPVACQLWDTARDLSLMAENSAEEQYESELALAQIRRSDRQQALTNADKPNG